MESVENKYSWETNIMDGTQETVYDCQEYSGNDVLNVAFQTYDFHPYDGWISVVSDRTMKDIEYARQRMTTYRSIIDGRDSTLGYNGSRYYEAAKTLLQLAENFPWYVGRADFRLVEHIGVIVNPDEDVTEVSFGIQFGFSKRDSLHGVLRMTYHQNVPPDIDELFQIKFEFPMQGKEFYVGKQYAGNYTGAVGYIPCRQTGTMTIAYVFPAPSEMQIDFAKTFNAIYTDPVMKPVLMDLALDYNDIQAKKKKAWEEKKDTTNVDIVS